MADAAKKRAWRWCAKYIKLRDAKADYPKTKDLAWVICRTCGKWLVTNSRDAQAGHFIPRSSGGSSGVYFDERNIAIQCSVCNRFEQGRPHEFERYVLEKYGQEVIDELRLKHHCNSYKGQHEAIAEMYRQMYHELQKGGE